MPSVASISQRIWDMKYRLKGPDGAALDKTIEESWRRIATALAAPEKEPALWAERFYEALTESGRHGRHLHASARGGADHAAGRRHRL